MSDDLPYRARTVTLWALIVVHFTVCFVIALDLLFGVVP